MTEAPWRTGGTNHPPGAVPHTRPAPGGRWLRHGAGWPRHPTSTPGAIDRQVGDSRRRRETDTSPRATGTVTWEELFDRGEAYAVTESEIREAVDAVRGGEE